MSDFDAEKWLRQLDLEEVLDENDIKAAEKTADELAAAKHKAEHYEHMYRELNIHANKHADNLREELVAAKARIAELERERNDAIRASMLDMGNLAKEQAISRKMYEALKMGEWADNYDQRRQEAIAEYEKSR